MPTLSQQPGTVSVDDRRGWRFAAVPLRAPLRDFGTLVERPLLPYDPTDAGIVGTPEAIDLNLISAPPSDPSIPPYGINERGEIAPTPRWFSGLSIR